MSAKRTTEEERIADENTATVKSAGRATNRKMSFKYKFLLILTSLILMGMLRTGFVFVIIAMLPSIVAYYMDVTTERYLFKTIFGLNLAGLLPSLGKMLTAGHSSALLQATMGNIGNWMMIYGAAMVGWLLIEICPMIANAMIVGFHNTQITRISRSQNKIQEEWGPEVRQMSEMARADEEDPI